MINADKNFLYNDITEKIISSAYRVYDKLGAGFLEKLYENALVIELKKQDLRIEQQRPVKVYYDDVLIGDYFADLIIEDKVIVELKAVSDLVKAHETQLVNYLKATGMKVGLLINFGEKITIKRKVMLPREEQNNYR